MLLHLLKVRDNLGPLLMQDKLPLLLRNHLAVTGWSLHSILAKVVTENAGRESLVRHFAGNLGKFLRAWETAEKFASKNGVGPDTDVRHSISILQRYLNTVTNYLSEYEPVAVEAKAAAAVVGKNGAK